ncbi:MAG: glycosyltransferase family 4 protein [Alphaproteobacteria bacterium]|nr:glycosyltransferase family 4 protein [Alphaproteobacteria bacterium]
MSAPAVAFYAPMKPPDDPRPSGDRRLARALLSALARAGFAPALASRFKSRDGAGDPARQQALIAQAEREADRLIAAYRAAPAATRPGLWLTYHSYYKAPDLLGPRVAAALGVPYVLVEASHAEKRLGGPHARFAAAAATAIRAADLVLQPNPDDRAGAGALLKPGARQVDFPPFLDIAPFAPDPARRAEARAGIAARLGLDPTACWLVTAAMMRPGAKQASYHVLAEALRRLPADAPSWALIAAGDGPARAAVEAAFADLPAVRLTPAVGQEAVAALYAAGDLFVWPAVEEAFGYALLEAQAAGLGAVVGDRPGVRALVAPGETAWLAPEGDAPAFAEALLAALRDPAARRAAGDAAALRAAARSDLAPAAERLGALLRALIGQPAA